MKITILGSGSAYGVPYFGGNWGACDPKNPKNRRSTASILIEKNGIKILVDMGFDLLRQSEHHNITILDGIIFTHEHADHIVGNFHVPIMMEYYNDKDLFFYSDLSTRTAIEKMWWFQYDNKLNAQFYGPRRPIWKQFQKFENFNIKDITILPIPQIHGDMTSYGLRIDNFCYSTDLNDMPPESFKSLENLDVWIVECDSINISNSHSHLEKTLTWIEKVKPKAAFLTHLDHTIDFDAVSRILPSNVSLCYDGQVILI